MIYKKTAKIIKRQRKNTLQSKQSSKNNDKTASDIIDDKLKMVRDSFSTGIGLTENKFSLYNGKLQVALVHIDTLTDPKLISSQVIEPLLNASHYIDENIDDHLTFIQTRIIYSANSQKTRENEFIVDRMLKGFAVLFVDGSSAALVIKCQRTEKRAIEKPNSELTIFGSMDSLTEDIDTNCNLIIKRLPTPKLRFEKFIVGRVSQTEVKLIWLEGIANSKIIEDVKKRIQGIDIDFVASAGNLSELLENNPIKLFSICKQTQRPDTIAKCLSNGQIAILSNNSPYCLIAPTTFWDNFKTMDDYADKALASSYLRLIRYLGFILATTASPLYLAFVAYNHSIVPPALAINISFGRAGVPLPSIVEILLLSLGITLIREASLRIPGSIGYFIGTISAVVIGQAAVSAGYVSASVIIVVAISTISAFAVSSNSLLYATRLINYFLITLSGFFGMFGIINGIAIIIWYMISLESFGVPYLYPVVPLSGEGMKDTFIRAPSSTLKRRLRILAPFNRLRIGKNRKYR